ncbi:NTP transferase domain-containing protein, partial [Symbiobacterium thermophilum]
MTGAWTGLSRGGPVDAVVLAAGESRRMGRPKMLLPWDGGTVLEAVVRSLLAAPVRRVAVVLGHRASEHRAALRQLARESRVLVVENPRYREGMLTSAQCGVAVLLREIPGGVASWCWEETRGATALLPEETRDGTAPLREQTRNGAVLLREEPRDRAEPRREESRNGTTLLREETRNRAVLLREETQDGQALLREETWDGAGLLREETRDGAALFREETRDGAGLLREETRDGAALFREETRDGAALLREETRDGAGLRREQAWGVAALHLTEARARDGATAVQTGSAPAETNRGADPAVVLIALGDQPLITPAVTASILTGHRGGLTVPTYAGRRGHPFCVDRSLLDDLLTLPPE